MIRILRNPEALQNEDFDIIIVGGGIYGAMLLLQAVQQDQRVLLVERGDFGWQTSFNSLRIIHGGLRYLQTLDIFRFRESVAERQWFLSNFPDLVKPMPCLMPLYNKGAKRLSILKVALMLNDLLSITRNEGVNASHSIENGRILNVLETREKFPGVNENDLVGAALWYDAHAPDTHRVIMETLKWACSMGGHSLNYVEVINVLKSANTVTGVQVKDLENGKTYEYKSRVVINATGPTSRSFASQFDRDLPELFRPSMAWNVLFKKPAPSEYALALTPDHEHAQTYFIHPWKGRLFAGTGHAPSNSLPNGSTFPGDELLESFVRDLNLVMPESNITMDSIEHVFWGLLPASEAGSTKLAKRAVIYDHASKGGLKGLYSISGIKFTTSRKEAERTIKYILKKKTLKNSIRPMTEDIPPITSVNYEWMPLEGDTNWKIELKKLIEYESVLHLDDLIFRRTSIGDNFVRVGILAKEIASLFDWDEHRMEIEINNLGH